MSDQQRRQIEVFAPPVAFAEQQVAAAAGAQEPHGAGADGGVGIVGGRDADLDGHAGQAQQDEEDERRQRGFEPRGHGADGQVAPGERPQERPADAGIGEPRAQRGRRQEGEQRRQRNRAEAEVDQGDERKRRDERELQGVVGGNA